MFVTAVRSRSICALALLLGLICNSPAWAHHSAGFIETDVPRPDGDSWSEVVGITFQTNGRGWAWERGGRIWIIDENNPVTTPFLDISQEVGAWHDHGFLGFALHPSFDQNGYVYLLYLVDRHHLLHCQEPAVGVGAPECDAGYDPNIDETFDAAMGRLTRYQAELPSGASDYSQATQVDLTTRTVFIGESISSGIPSTSRSHVTGSLVFGTDKTLLVSTGDGARSSGDAGSAFTVPDANNYTLQALADGILHPDQDVGSNRSQMLGSLNGKILRIDPDTGDGVSSNPYFDNENPRSVESRVWAFGLRNPFRTSLKPDTGSHDPADADPGILIVGDVGRNAWEEINIVESPGQNFGWPLYEGMDIFDSNSFARGNIDNKSAPNPRFGIGGCTEEFFQFSNLIVQDTLNTPSFPNPCDSAIQISSLTPTHVHVRPVLTWRHGTDETRSKSYDGSGSAVSFRISNPSSPIQGTEFRGSSATGGIVYPGTDFPAEYQGNYFFADFTGLWMRRLVFDAGGNAVAVEEFSDEVGGVVSIASNPASNGLYYISWTTQITRLDFAPGGNFAPEAVLTADTLFGPSPLTIQFDGSNSTDPEIQPLTYSWDFGDGTTSTNPSPQHTFTTPDASPASFTVTLTVDDGLATDSTSVVISPNNSPPNASIISPVDGTSFPLNTDTTYDLIANITDVEHTQSQLSCEWLVALHHNTHSHQSPPLLGCQQQAIISDEGCDGDTYFYRIDLTVTDPFGLTTSDSVDLSQADCAGGPFTPVANGDLATVTTGGSTTIPILLNDLDDTGLDPASVLIESQPVGASITSIDGLSGDVNLLHDGTTTGPLTFTYSVADLDNVRSNVATVLVNVSSDQNTAPQIAVLVDVTLAAGELRSIGLSASDADGDGLSFSSANLPGFATLNDFGDGTGEIQFAPAIADIGQYTITVDVTDDASSPLVDSTDFIVTVTAMAGDARVSAGLVVFYPLTEGAGTTAADASDNGTPMNLQLSGAVSWLGSGPGLSFNGGHLGTSAAASKVINALQSSSRSTFELFVLPANVTQTGPARLVSVGGDNASQNFMLGQDGPDYQVRLQHTAKDSKSRPRLQAANAVAVAVQHVVHSYDGGVERLYIDGVEQPATVALSGNYSSWDSTDLFNVGNGASFERPFVGEIYLVAVYDRALTPTEIQQNFAAGLGGTLPVNQPPVSNAGADQTVVLPNTLMLAGAVTDDGLPNPPGAVTVTWSQVSGPGTAIFTDDTALTSTVSFDVDGVYTLRLTAIDGEWINTDDVVITVDPIVPIPVPDVVGQTQAAAESAIISAGLTVGTITTANSATVPAGDVINQSPLGGTLALPGSAVDLTVSLGPVPIPVPDVIGQMQTTAESTIISAGLIVGTVTTVSSATVPVGEVIDQNPLGGGLAVPGSAVDLTVSSGPAPVTVPDVVGMMQTSAESVIVSAGLTVGTITTANSATVPVDNVIEQSPLGGTLAAPGSAVNLTVSLGPVPIPVPDVIGQMQTTAESTIISAGFTLGTVTTVSSATVPAGEVIDQNPLGGSLVLPGFAVDLTVSSGPAPVTVPDVIGQTQTDAETAITNAGLTVGTITTANSDTVPAGDVIDQSPLGGTLAAPGSAVALTVSDGPPPPNNAPALDPIGVQGVAEGDSLTLPLSANDVDGHSLSFGHDGLPGFMALTDNGNGTATLSIAPNFDDSGGYSITIRVTDNGIPPLSAEETFDLTVDNVNRAPQINNINNVTMMEGESLTLPISASDPDGDGVNFSSPDLPGFATLNNLTGNDAEIVISPTSVDVGAFTVTIEATDDATSPLASTTTFNIDVQALETRVTTGLLAYYPFTAGSGTVVSDQSGSGPPMDLDFSGSVTWLSGSNGVSFSGGRVGTNTAASKIINALMTSGASSFEVWALPANATQVGPARLVSVGADNANQNFMLGQDGADYQARLLHTAKDSKARPRLQVVNGVSVAVQHLVHTYDGSVERLYIGGVQQSATVALSGNYNNWDPTDWFNIGNEASSQRPFVGEVYLVAVYDRALSVAEVQMNFSAGPNGDSSDVGPVTAFTDITVAAGVTSPAEFGGHGAQFADVDGNGLADIYVTRNFQPTDMPELFYKNQGAGIFLEEAATRGIENFDTGSHGGVWADFDNDGDFDLFNGSDGQNRLYENNGNGVFTDVTMAAGLPVQSLPTRAAIAFDMDGDGDLDIFAVSNFQGTNDPPGELNEVYRNDGGLTFTPVSAGDLEAAPAGQGALAVDFDNDGDLDVFAGNRTGPMNVLVNNGAGIFTLIDPASIGLSISAADGITAADVNNDGLLDLMLDQHLFLGTGSGQFSFSRSFETTSNHYMGGFADLDNDGDYDLVFPGRNYIYLNDGSGTFTASNVFAIGTINDPRSVSFADIDRDGDLDFYIAQKRASDLLIRNDTAAAGNWLKISLTRLSGQIGAFGARVTVYEAGGLGDPARRIMWKEATSATGYLAQDDPELHFGLGTETLVDVRVVFLGGAVVNLTNIPSNVLVSVIE